jgi:hypothetical protein
MESTNFNEANTGFTFFRKTPISDIRHLTIGYPKEPRHMITMINKETGKRFKINDLQGMVYKRNQQIESFFSTYGDTYKFTIVETSFPDNKQFKLSTVMSCIKSRSQRNGNRVLGYIWLIDVGENHKAHFHIAVAYSKIKTEGDVLPKYLKYQYKGKKVYSSFVRNIEKYKNYLKGKKVYERGVRKRSYNKSIRFITKT